MGINYLGFKRRAKKAAKLFRKQLLANGIEKGVADTLTDDYLRSSEVIGEAIRAWSARNG